jgi:cell division protein FtsL
MKLRPIRRPRARTSLAPRARRVRRRLGPIEWMLLVVIALAVAVTAAMAIFNPA